MTLATGLALIAWIAQGADATLEGLQAPGTRAVRGVVGIPLPGAADVGAVRNLLSGDPASDSVLILYPPGVPTDRVVYVQYQLTYALHPRHVDVKEVSSATGAAGFGTLISTPGLHMEGLGTPAIDRDGFRLYRALQR